MKSCASQETSSHAWLLTIAFWLQFYQLEQLYAPLDLNSDHEVSPHVTTEWLAYSIPSPESNSTNLKSSVFGDLDSVCAVSSQCQLSSWPFLDFLPSVTLSALCPHRPQQWLCSLSSLQCQHWATCCFQEHPLMIALWTQKLSVQSELNNDCAVFSPSVIIKQPVLWRSCPKYNSSNLTTYSVVASVALAAGSP